MREFRVGVFEHPAPQSSQLMAYTRWYNPGWDGCCEHRVMATNGTEAKKIATKEHRESCMKERNP